MLAWHRFESNRAMSLCTQVVDALHELTVDRPGGIELVGALAKLFLRVEQLTFELCHLVGELSISELADEVSRQ